MYSKEKGLLKFGECGSLIPLSVYRQTETP